MKYHIGDKITLKPIEWFEFNKDFKNKITRGTLTFTEEMTEYCECSVVIEEIDENIKAYGVRMQSNELKWIAEWAIDMYTTDKLMYAKSHGLKEPIIDRNKVLAISKFMDSNKLFSQTEIEDPDIKIEGEITLSSTAEKFDKQSGRLIGTVITEVPDRDKVPIVTEVKPRRGRKPGSKNKPKANESIKAPEGTTKLTKGSKIIAWNDSKSKFIVGRYEGSNSNGYLIRTNKTELEVFKNIHLYSEKFLFSLINKTFKDTDQTLLNYNKLIAQIESMIKTFEEDYGVSINRNFELIQ